MVKNCIICGKEHDGSFGSGLYCSKSCASIANKEIEGINYIPKDGEIFKLIEGTDHYYVSNYGTVISKYNNNFNIKLKEHIVRGLMRVAIIYANGVKRDSSVAFLVLSAFNKRDNKVRFVANHIDGDKTNNRFENLEWTLRRRKPIKVKNLTTGVIYDSILQAAKLEGVSTSTIYRNCNNNNRFTFIKD